jgi:hypothetical protein
MKRGGPDRDYWEWRQTVDRIDLSQISSSTSLIVKCPLADTVAGAIAGSMEAAISTGAGSADQEPCLLGQGADYTVLLALAGHHPWSPSAR